MAAAALDRLDLRQLSLLIGGAFALLVAILFSYVLWPSIDAYRKESVVMRALEQATMHGKGVSAELERVAQDVAALEKQLHGDMANLPENQLEAFVIGRLQTISWRNNVALLGVEPDTGDAIRMFRESLFDIELSGDYFDLFAWLSDIEQELGFVVIKEYEMRPIEDITQNPQLTVRLTIASYRIAQI